MTELLERFCNEREFYHFEGDRGIERLNVITEALGYAADGLLYGSSLERFLGDNSGAMEALLEWIGDHVPECWEVELTEALEDEEEDEDGLLAVATGLCLTNLPPHG